MFGINTHTLSQAYIWMISSVWRVVLVAILLSTVILAAALTLPTWAFGLVVLLIILLLGLAANRVRQSYAALDFPGIDRFFQQVPCYLTIQDRNLRIIRTNDQFRKAFGSAQGELCFRAYKGSDKACPDCPVLRTFDDGQTHTKEETVTLQDGSTAQMIVYTTPVKNERGDIVGVMEMSTDITQIKQLQNEIEASRKEYRDLFERVPCYISVLNKDLKIIRVNSLFKEVFGDRTGDRCYQVYHDRETVCPECLVLHTLNDGKIHSSEKTVIRPDGTEARLIIYSSPIYDESGELTEVMEMATDITEVKKLQAELTYMGKTIAIMAHRIKNILSGLEGGIFVMNTGWEDNDEALTRKGWQMIERNVANVSRIVKDLLYCSKEREMAFQQIDPAPTVVSVHELFTGRAQRDNIELILDMPDSLPEGRFDPEALHSLLTNLVTNAFEACRNDATEGREHYHVTIRGRCEDDGAHVFEVEDNGSGIPGHVGESLFEEFFSTKGREGTGLGLLVAQKVVEEHGGVISFLSNPGEGTSFRATFPPSRA
ncbi:MAG: PAS domain-containing protein [candidate division Zixibacteria bacterium]|nr:PAS domain-containing protein [candidate division Zixibacteria bacterium]